jgi:hypothetical protein
MSGLTSAVLAEEIDDCIARIAAFQKARGRRVFKLIKSSPKGREGIAAMADFGLPIPEDFAALYDHFDGVAAAARMSFWESTVFLDAFWPESAMLIDSNRIARLEKHFAAEQKICAFLTTQAVSYDLFPALAQDGAVPLVANLGPLSQRKFIAFDSTLAMLRSVCAAQDAGILSYAVDRTDFFPPYGRGVEKDEILFDPKELWEVIRAFNTRAEYWELFAQGPVDWQETSYEMPKDGRLQLDPEVRAIVLGQPKPKP